MRDQRYGAELKAGACDKSDINDQYLNANMKAKDLSRKVILIDEFLLFNQIHQRNRTKQVEFQGH